MIPKSNQERTAGTGDWWLFDSADISKVEAAAAEWRTTLEGVEKPWLCWAANDRWCVLQQKLVRYADF